MVAPHDHNRVFVEASRFCGSHQRADVVVGVGERRPVRLPNLPGPVGIEGAIVGRRGGGDCAVGQERVEVRKRGRPVPVER